MKVFAILIVSSVLASGVLGGTPSECTDIEAAYNSLPLSDRERISPLVLHSSGGMGDLIMIVLENLKHDESHPGLTQSEINALHRLQSALDSELVCVVNYIQMNS